MDNIESLGEYDDRLGDFTTDFRVVALSGMAVIIGCISAAVAWVLMRLIGMVTNLAYFHKASSTMALPEYNHLGYWALLVPVVGGLIIGVMARYGSPKIRGHGIPEALEAILIGRSMIEPKVAILKPISSAISIGTGGPFGAEGPIIMTGGACGSIFAQLFHLSSAERKTLLAAGAAGGMAAIFSSPVAAVLLALELLLFEWKPRSFIPVAVASVVAAALRVPLLGPGPMFPVPLHQPLAGPELVWAFGVGITAGILSTVVTNLVYGCEDLFHRLPIHWMWWPAIGGVVVGIGGLIHPRVLGVGYDTIQDLLLGHVTTHGLIAILFMKAIVWGVALGSGTSGGVVAPLLMIGGALGALEGHLIPVGDAGLWAIVGMAAVMGGTMRAPFTAIVFTIELTHDLNIFPAILVACIASVLVTILAMKRSILTEKVARRGHHLTYEFTVDPLTLIRVGAIMEKNFPVIPAGTKLSAFREPSQQGTPRAQRRQGPIVDDEGRLVGIITQGDFLRALEEESPGEMTVLDAGKKDVIIAYPDETLFDALTKMIRHKIGRLPVVTREDPRKLVGYLGRAEIMNARLPAIEEESLREQSWKWHPWRSSGGSKNGERG